MSVVTVFSKKPCVQCNATFRALDKRGIEYKVIDITVDPNVLGFLQDTLDAIQAPVVVLSDVEFTIDENNENFDATDVTVVEHWTGFNPDKILELE